MVIGSGRRLADLHVRPYRRQLEPGLSLAERQGFDLRLLGGDGQAGLGEVAPLETFGSESLAEAGDALMAARALLSAKRLPGDLGEIPHLLEALGLRRDRTPAAYAGVELCLLDLLARWQQRPLASLLAAGQEPRLAVPVNALLAGTDAERIALEAVAAKSAGFSAIKIKVGVLAPEAAVRLLSLLRDRLGPDILLRADVGRAWPPALARMALAALADLDLDYVEEPCVELAALLEESRQRQADLPGSRFPPLAADESACPAAQGWRWLAAPVRPDVFIVKPLLLGGLLEARQFMAAAMAAGSQVVLTSALEGPVGLAAALHLAAALPGELPACGLATASWARPSGAAQTLPGWLIPRQGSLWVPLAPGLGLGVK